MKHRALYALGLIVLGLVGFATSLAEAESSGSKGPYYAIPSWDQQLDVSKRFIVLSNWGNGGESRFGGDAVLDKETGLVWERSPHPVVPAPYNLYNWLQAQAECIDSYVGGRMGWRLPTIQELASLNDPSVPSPGPALPVGHPFINVLSEQYWSATINARDTTMAWTVNFQYGGYGATLTSDKSNIHNVWCVRGGSGSDTQ